ncbi:two-partner secretion domain-containing protein [Aliarcobacter butzleri]|uniref:two-partner secretion domain-containing protein n=1 Tax=Aliarcobacter butzleri TaxID=28197 RepID=UPI00214ADD1C|nr:hemagglutinin repeat-containing protein [Aliarcobacter butzleri]MCP3649139.1 hemagglutinin repeat-containing protein [Arcobacter sp. DNRA7]MCR1815313.1 hemagglutinin repeat-containing protein [Aliarcobacter butzleri]
MKIIKRIISIKISCLLVAQQSLIAGGLTVDKTAPSSNQANIESARNGVPIVNIVAPNQKGLSHNKFSDYNVNKEGLILNNSNKREVNTQLSGYIYGNQNLKNGTAKTILNEVTSKNKSELKGFTEVAGDRANVVVSNPNGIYINGAGFINTSRATITTGNPNIKNGEIDSFDVRQGQIDVDGEGLNLSNVNKAELYAQTVKLNAKIHAQDLDVVTGQNSISKDGTITNIENSTDEKPTVSLDSSALGGIYANKISLVGTQKGVGVNLPIEISAQDDFKLSADGKIVLDKVISEKNIDIKSDSSDINTKIIYGNNVNIEAKNSIKNEDVIASKTNIDLKANNIENKDANIQAVKDITITSKNIDNSKGTISSNNNLELDVIDFKGNNSTIQAQKIDIKANDFEAKSSNILATNGNLDIKVNNLDLDNSLQIGALDNVNIKSNEAKLNNTKIVSKKGNISFDTNSLELEKSIVSASKYLDINTTYLKNTQGNLQASNIDVKANKFQANNSKIVAMDGNLNIESKDLEINNSNITSFENIDIKTDNLKSISGNIQALQDINITSKNIDNSNGTIATNENLTINSSKDGFFNNIKGKLQSGKKLILDIFNFQGDNSKFQASNIDIKANNFEAKSSNIVAINGNLDINSNILNLDNSSQIASMKNLSIVSNEAKLNNSKVFNQNGYITLNSKDLELNGSILSASKYLDINTTYLKNISGYIEALEDINIISKNMNNSNGIIVTNENLTINSQNNGTFNNKNAVLQANKNLLLNSFNFQGDNSKLQASNIDIKANNFEAKSSNIVAINGNLDINSNILNLDNSLQIASLKDINITSNQAKLNNSKILSQDGNISFDTNSLELNKSIVNASNKINIQSSNLKNKDGNIQAVKDISIASKNIDNENGVIATNENLTINSSKDGFFNNIKGKLQSGKKLVLDIFNFQGDNSNIQASNIDIKANNFEAKSSNIVAINGNLDIETDSFILEDSYLNIKNNLSLNSKNSLNLKDNTIVGNNLNISADEIYFDGTSQNKNILYSTNDILMNTKKLISNYLFTQANNNINIDSSNIDLKNSKFQNVVFIDSIYQNGYKQGDINLTTSNLNLYNTTLASKDINIKKGTNQKLQTLVVENSSLDVNNNIDVSTTTLNAKKSLFSALNDLLLTTDKSIVFLNNNFSANNLSLSIDENLTLDKSNSFLANNNFSLNTKSLVNNAQIISNGNLTINTNDFIVNNALLSSKNILSLNATNYILNNDSNEPIFGIRGAVTNLNTKLLTNYGFITSLYDMNIKVDDLINYAGIASANSENKTSNMNVEANNLTNYNTIYSNDNINLYIKNSLKNITDNKVVNLGNEKAIVFATNNIVIQGDKDKSLRTSEILNQSADIKTEKGDINFFVNNLENKRSQKYEDLYEIYEGNEDYRYFKYPSIPSERIVYIKNKTKDVYYNVLYPEYNLKIYLDSVKSGNGEGMSVDIKEIRVKDELTSQNSLIFSGNNLHLNTNKLINEISNIVSKNNIYFSNNMNIVNKELNFFAKLDFYNIFGKAGYHNFFELDTGKLLVQTNNSNPTYTYYYQNKIVDSLIQSGGKIYGDINKLENGVSEGKILEYKAYIPNQNTKVQTANIQTNKKIAENKNIEEKNTSTIKVENKVLNSDEIKIKDNEKIEESSIKVENKVLNSDEIKLKENERIEGNDIEEKEKSSIKVESKIVNSDDIKLKHENKIVLNPIDENYILPTNKYSTFTTVNANKNLNYLVESNPLYTNYSNFIGSSYFLEKMNYQSDKTMKRLGDAAYETKLVSDAIFKQTGQRFLSQDYTSENKQFVALMENAVNLSGVLGLELGKPLSKQQLVNLTEDIVWMEEKVVNGQTVLVPVVYLAKDYNKLQGASIIANSGIELKVKDNVNNLGTIKSGSHIDINALGVLNNIGTIHSKGYMNIQSNSITNNLGVILADGKAVLISNNDFINKNGGLIKASDIQIASLNGSVINETYSKTDTIKFERNDYTYTNIGKTSSIESTNGNLIIQAKNDITNTGANLSATNSVLLQTQNGDINLNAIELKVGHNIKLSGGFDKAIDIEYQTSNIDANNIIMQSGRDINLEASKLNATNQINLNAQNDVNIEALNNVYYRDTQTTKKGTFSKTTKRDMVYKESVDSAELNANDILINANNDVNLQAAKLKAQDNIIVNAKDGDVNIVAKEYREGELHEKSKSSWGGLKKSLDISSTDALKLNSALLETQASNVVLTSGKDINILASQINSGADIQLKALNDVLIASQSEYLKTQEVHKKSSFNLAGLASLVVPVDTTIYSSEIHKNDKLSSSSVASKLNANKDILIDSGSTTIVGSNLEANNIGIKADTGEINILSSQDVQNATSLDKEIKLGLSDPIKGIVQNTKNMFSGETKVKFEVGSLTYDEVDKASQTTKNNSSNLKAKENLVLDSLTDINVQGSNLKAGENLVLNSKVGDINILNTTDTHNEDIKEKHAKASVNVTVQNEYVETAQAVKSAVKSAEQLKQTKDDYSKYKSEVKKLENTLSDLKQRYKAKEVGIDYSDIEDLSDFIDNLKSQEKYYVAAIAAATADLASKTVAIATQVTAAGSSSVTLGFSAGISLDVNGEKSHTSNSNQTSNASNLNGKNIYINTDEKLSTNTNVIGSNVIADENLYINTNNLNVKASQDNYTSKNDSESINGSIAFTMYGGGGGTAGLGYGKSNSSSDSFLNNNSQLSGNNVNINVTNDANFVGANVRANDTLNLNVGNNLVLESLRDEYSSNSKGFNVNAGVGFGSGGKEGHRTPSLDVGKQSSTNAGFSVNNGVTQNKQTVLSSITGDKVNVNVGNNTHLKGSLLASGNYDEKGIFQDNQNLNFTTNTLTFGNLSNSNYSSSKSLGVNVNYNLEDKKVENAQEKPQQKGVSSVGYNDENSLSANASKTLATLGQGNVTVKDVENSDELDRLNRDTNAVNKDLYSSSTGTKVDATLDTRLLTVEGREQIKKEYEDMGENMSIIANTLPDASSDNPVESAIGNIWNWIAHGTLDILPSNQNNGGALGNIPIWFGINDNLHKLQGDENSKNVYINGILNSQTDAMQGGKNIIGEDNSYLNLYNPTRGILGDIIEAGIDKWGNDIGMQTGISKQVQEYLNNNKDLNVYLHSQGNLITKEGALSSKDNGHVYKSYGAPMSDKDISVIFNINEKKYIRKNEGDYVANPINIFDPSTWNKPGHGTENYKPIQ